MPRGEWVVAIQLWAPNNETQYATMVRIPTDSTQLLQAILDATQELALRAGATPEDVTPPIPLLLRPSEVARVFRVTTQTVARWAKDGKLQEIRTPDGSRRYRRDHVMQLLKESGRGG